MEATQSSEAASQRRSERRSVPPGLEAPAPPIDGPTDTAGAERVMKTADSLREEHARQLRNLLERFAAEYDLQAWRDRIRAGESYVEASSGAGTLCADPGPALAAFLSILNVAIDGAEEAEVVTQ